MWKESYPTPFSSVSCYTTYHFWDGFRFWVTMFHSFSVLYNTLGWVPQFIDSIVIIYLGGLYLGAITNNAATNILVHVFLYMCMHLEGGRAGSISERGMTGS